MVKTSADCKKGTTYNFATGRCVSSSTEKKLRHKMGDFSNCPEGKARNAKNRCVAKKVKDNKIKKLKKEYNEAEKAAKKLAAELKKKARETAAKIQKNAKKLVAVEKKLNKAKGASSSWW